MAENSQIQISYRDRTVMIRGESLRPTPRFLNLYLLLALARIEDPQSNGGYVEAEQILHLPQWERNNLTSVGKQIRRHMLEMQQRGACAIESAQKIKGPFRLAAPPSEIAIDISRDELAGHLHLALPEPRLSQAEEQRFYEYVEQMWQASALFNDGDLAAALAAYRKAEELSLTIAHRQAAMHHIARILERQGNYEESFRTAETILESLPKAGPFQVWARAKAHVLIGWINYLKKQYGEAIQNYYQALALIEGGGHFDINGHIWNGLGKVAERQNRLQDALSHYQRALECWILAEDFYGVQSIYFNIAQIHYRWGRQAAQRRYKPQARAKYEEALHWVEKCTAVCQRHGLADEINDDHLLTASLLWHLGRWSEAVDALGIAHKMALRSGNARALASTYRALAKGFVFMGLIDYARSVFSLWRKLPETFHMDLDSLERSVEKKSKSTGIGS